MADRSAALRNPRSGMVWVAAAGPAMNIALAILAALAFHLEKNRSAQTIWFSAGHEIPVATR